MTQSERKLLESLGLAESRLSTLNTFLDCLLLYAPFCPPAEEQGGRYTTAEMIRYLSGMSDLMHFYEDELSAAVEMLEAEVSGAYPASVAF